MTIVQWYNGAGRHAGSSPAAQLPSCVLREMPARPLTGNAAKLEHFARRREMELYQSGGLAAQFGLPVELLSRGGFFPASLPAAVLPHVHTLRWL